MKKSLISLMIALMAIALFSACDKENDSSGGNTPNPSEINAKNVMNSNSEIVSVKAVLYDENTDEEVILATSPYQNNGFKLTLKTPPASCLYSIGDDLEPEMVISDPKAKIGDVEVAAFNNNDEEIGGFYYWGANTRTYAEANYVYADRNFTIKGKIMDEDEYLGEYNCSFKKGWNIIYMIAHFDEETVLITTRKPSGITMEWEFDIYLLWKSNQHQNLFKMHENVKARMQKTFNR